MKRTGKLSLALATVGLSLMITSSVVLAQSPVDQAWSILQSAVTDKQADQRAAAMRALQLLPGQAKAIDMAEQTLQDKDPAVRAAAALSLGAMRSKNSVPKLTAALSDKDGGVVMAAAKSLTELGDEKGFAVYYAVVTGTHKSGSSLVGGEEKELNQILSNPGQMATMAFEQGIGFVPFGGIGYGAYQHFHQSAEKEQIVQAVAVRVLANDPDPRSGKALVTATTSKSWLVRTAAYDALARRGEKALLAEIQAGLRDQKEEVKLTAAAAVIRLSN